MQTTMLAGAQTAPAQCRAPCRRATAAMVPAVSCGARSNPLPTFTGFRQNSLQTAQVRWWSRCAGLGVVKQLKRLQHDAVH